MVSRYHHVSLDAGTVGFDPCFGSKNLSYSETSQLGAVLPLPRNRQTPMDSTTMGASQCHRPSDEALAIGKSSSGSKVPFLSWRPIQTSLFGLLRFQGES